jgi:hypothetical protein
MSGLVVCPTCSSPVPTGRFCTECGSKMTAAAPAPPPPPPPQAAAAPQPAPAPPAAKAAPGRKPAAEASGLREWIEVQRSKEPSAIYQRPENVEAMATALRRVRDQKVLPDEVFKAIHGALQLKGPGGLLTVGLGSLSWRRLEAGQWVATERPGWLFLPAQAIDEAASAALPGAPVVTPGSGS